MPRAADIIAVVARTFEEDEKGVTQTARFLREAGRFVKETRWSSTWTAGPADAAWLAVAIMTGTPAHRIKDDADAIANSAMSRQDFDHAEMLPAWFKRQMPALYALHADVPSCSFVDCLAAILTLARDEPDEFRWWTYCKVELEQRSLVGTLGLNMPRNNLARDQPEPADAYLHFSPYPDTGKKARVTFCCEYGDILSIAEVLRDQS